MFRRGHDHDPRAALWATLTIIAFPIVSLTFGWLGMNPFASFTLGALASLLVLLLEGALRGRWWISEPAVARVLSDPALCTRLLILVGITLLIFQSVVLVGFLTDRTADENIVRYILRRECPAPGSAMFASICSQPLAMHQDSQVDPLTMTIREAAEKRFIPGGFVTCAARPLATDVSVQTLTHSALVRCDQWVIGRIAGLPVSVATVQRTVASALTVQADGTYRIDGWCDDPSSAEWMPIAGPISDMTLQSSYQKEKSLEVNQELASETFRRAMERLSNR